MSWLLVLVPTVLSRRQHYVTETCLSFLRGKPNFWLCGRLIKSDRKLPVMKLKSKVLWWSYPSLVEILDRLHCLFNDFWLENQHQIFPKSSAPKRGCVNKGNPRAPRGHSRNMARQTGHNVISKSDFQNRNRDFETASHIACFRLGLWTSKSRFGAQDRDFEASNGITVLNSRSRNHVFTTFGLP